MQFKITQLGKLFLMFPRFLHIIITALSLCIAQACQAEPADPLSYYIEALESPKNTQPVITTKPKKPTTPHKDIVTICNRIGKKLGSVSTKDCLKAKFDAPRFYSNRGQPLLEKHFPANPERRDAPPYPVSGRHTWRWILQRQHFIQMVENTK